MRVDCYRNLHKNCISVRALEGQDKGKVIAHEKIVMIWMPTFVVQESGRLRLIREKKKNVHAFVRGQWLKGYGDQIPENVYKSFDKTYAVMYDPYQFNSFVMKADNKQITTAQFVIIGPEGIFVEIG